MYCVYKNNIDTGRHVYSAQFDPSRFSLHKLCLPKVFFFSYLLVQLVIRQHELVCGTWYTVIAIQKCIELSFYHGLIDNTRPI